jgi:hypothetical protein
MKHLKLFENSTEYELKMFIQQAVKRGDITLNVDINDLITNNKPPKIGTFEYFLEDDARFISAHDSQRMTEYVSKLKEMGADVSKLESMLDDYVRYHKIFYLEDNLQQQMYNSGSLSKEERKEIEIQVDKILTEQDGLSDIVKQFKIELVKVLKDAKEL